MKRLPLIILLLCLAADCFGQAFMANRRKAFRQASGVGLSSLVSGLAAYWNMDEMSGNRADSVGANTANDNNTVGYTSGLIGNCSVMVSNQFRYLSVSDNASISTENSSITIAGWFNWHVTNIQQTIISKYTTTGNGRELIVRIEPGIHRLNILYYTNSASSGGYLDAAMSTRIGPTNEWVFFAMVADLTAYKLTCFVKDPTMSEIKTNIIATPLAQSGGAAPLIFGSYQGTLQFFDGKIDEVGFWRRALTTNELITLYSNGVWGTSYPWTGQP